MKEYIDLLKKRADLEEQLLFKTDKGLITFSQLEKEVLSCKEIKYLMNCSLSETYLFSDESLYDVLCCTVLRENFSVKIDMKNKDIYISKKEKELSEDYKKLFPPIFFMPLKAYEENILTCMNKGSRFACNENHRLSQFIIKNGAKLKEHVPGIFNEILRILADEKGVQLIKKINNILKDLRMLPEGLFEIPDTLFLTEDDLYYQNTFLKYFD